MRMVFRNISDPPHVGGQLIDFVYSGGGLQAGIKVPQVRDVKFVACSTGELWMLQICTPYPVSFGLKPINKVGANKAARPRN